ncbi:diacylglycerol kinase family protein [bacterium]|jgi:undecaprenol kinase|nr:diacylglycerol kinase family protein [bacterium]MBT4251006.1 diacylglycerol kinase family protein [bacterium]MBT4597762.1 diacylglycerol kinase family protein [bacterium]MBT6753857.1 diacylglycerol kinase family protein [bacterium]MBT7037431.1 diacylglycerol kinase family protein [bacterium]
MKINRLFHSFGHAITGFRFALRKEQNFKIEVLAGILVIGAMFLVGVKTWEAIVLVIMIAGVLILEVLNTSLEQLVNMLKPRVHPKARVLKDLMATSVFLAAIASAIVGVLIFWPYIFK